MLGTLGVRWKYSLDGIPAHHKCLHSKRGNLVLPIHPVHVFARSGQGEAVDC